MACNTCTRSVLQTTSTTSQTTTAGGTITFTNNVIDLGNGIGHVAGASTITIDSPGIYQVSFNGLGTAGTSTSFTVQMYNNGVAAPTAVGSSIGTSSVSFTTLVRVLPSCCAVNNTANITFVASEATTFTEVEVNVMKVR